MNIGDWCGIIFLSQKTGVDLVMTNLVNFMQNPIVIAWIAPVIVTAIISIWRFVIKRIIDEYKGMPRSIARKCSLDVFEEYCKKHQVKTVSSYGSAQKTIKLNTIIDKNAVGIKADIDVSEKPSNTDRNFVMVFLKYLPKLNMSYYCRKGYSLGFDIKSDKGVCGIQLEIKDVRANKVIDEYVSVSKELKHYSFKLCNYSGVDSWKEINEICFTLFLEDGYITKNKGKLFISNCNLKIVD